MTARGRAFVAWGAQFLSEGGDRGPVFYEAAARPAGARRFRPAQRLEMQSSAQAQGNLDLVVDANSRATVAWNGWDGSHYRVRAADTGNGLTFGAPQDVSPAGAEAFEAALATAPGGRRLVAWVLPAPPFEPQTGGRLQAAVAPMAADAWARFIELFGSLRETKSPWPAEMERVARWYEPHLQRIYEDAFVRQRDIAQLQQIAATYPSRERFLTELALDPPAATSDEADAPGRDDDYLVLSTIHSAKGQEWKTVHVLNVVDGCIPSDLASGTSEELEEERRLLYVAMTRATDHLHVVVPQRFYVHSQAAHGDRHVYASRTRFIPEAIVGLFESCVWPEAVEGDDHCAERASPAPAIDVAARIRALWNDVAS